MPTKPSLHGGIEPIRLLEQVWYKLAFSNLHKDGIEIVLPRDSFNRLQAAIDEDIAHFPKVKIARTVDDSGTLTLTLGKATFRRAA